MKYIDKIILEWAYRVSDGTPDAHNSAHQLILREILEEFGGEISDINESIDNLNEVSAAAEKAKALGLVSKGYGRWADPKTDKVVAQTVKGQLVPVGKKKVKKEPEKEKPKEKSVKKSTKSQAGQLSDKDDELSDGAIKQKGLEIGFKEVGDFKPAPGNAGSMLAEIMSGEIGTILENNPNMSDEELIKAVYDQVKDTTLGEQNSGSKTATSRSRTVPEGLNVDLYNKCKSIAKAGKEKHQRMNDGVDKLKKDGKISKPVKTRNFYGHQVSIQKQVELIEKSDGPFYTNQGVEIPKPVLIDLIKKSGGGENPSDTSTIAIDEQGRGVVTFHSDKLNTDDIQANSTPNKESEQAKELVDKTDISDKDKKKAKSVIEKGQKRLAEKENQLKQAANQPAKDMADGDLDQILDDIKNDKGIPGKDKVSTKLSSLMSRGKPHPSIVPYLEGDGPYSDKDKLKAFYKFAGDDDRKDELTGKQLQLLYRSAKQNGYDISADLGRIREESLHVQRETHSKLNEQEVTLPDGTKKPMGDYIEAQNVLEKLHIGVVDGEEGHGVGKYPGLFNLNMGGTVVEAGQLKECLNVTDSEDFVSHFEVGKPGDGEDVIKSRQTGQITGRNIFVYAITKEGKRIPIAVKTQRSKQGESGKLSTTYQWHKDTQNCFKEKS